LAKAIKTKYLAATLGERIGSAVAHNLPWQIPSALTTSAQPPTALPAPAKLQETTKVGSKYVLVTGHHGYIGALLVKALQDAGFVPTGLDTDLFDQNRFVGHVPLVPSIQKDLRDVVPADLEGFEAVLHLAALSNDPLGDLDPTLTYQINHEATMQLARFAKQARVRRFLFSSSCSMYGAAGDAMLDESASFNPVTPYAHSKVMVENQLRALANDDFSPVFLRNTTAYGVSPFMRFDIVLNNLVGWAYTTGKVAIQSDGTPWRPLIHIEDICRAFVAALQAPREAIHNQAFNVGLTEENYQVRDLARVVQETVPGCVIEYSPHGSPDPRSYRVNFSKIKDRLPGFRPAWNIRRGAQELYAACQQANLTFEDFDGPRFKRLTHIRKLLANGSLDSRLRWTSGQPVEAPAASGLCN
jgi:nucleoside-diphosphate-sugar epimerase